LLPDVSNPLKHASEVKLFIGTSETIATVRLLNAEVMSPGEEGWIQLELRDPIVTVRGDKYILRRPSPAETLGGGLIIDAQPKDRHKRMDVDVIKRLSTLLQGSPADVLMQASLALGAASVKDVIARSRLEKDSAEAALAELLSSQTLIPLDEITSQDYFVVAAPHWSDLKTQIENTVSAYHREYPLRGGMAREELKSKLKLVPRLFNIIIKKLAKENVLTESGAWIARPGHTIKFNPVQEANIHRLLAEFAKAPFSPPSVKEAQAIVGEEVFTALIDLGALTQVAPDVVFRKQDYETMLEKTKSHIQAHGQITVAEFRDLFNTSRKYALGLLEHLDVIGVTTRDGDYRKLKR
jgi:selenocysteine-specific elongation factor